MMINVLDIDIPGKGIMSYALDKTNLLPTIGSVMNDKHGDFYSVVKYDLENLKIFVKKRSAWHIDIELNEKFKSEGLYNEQ